MALAVSSRGERTATVREESLRQGCYPRRKGCYPRRSGGCGMRPVRPMLLSCVCWLLGGTTGVAAAALHVAPDATVPAVATSDAPATDATLDAAAQFDMLDGRRPKTLLSEGPHLAQERRRTARFELPTSEGAKEEELRLNSFAVLLCLTCPCDHRERDTGPDRAAVLICARRMRGGVRQHWRDFPSDIVVHALMGRTCSAQTVAPPVTVASPRHSAHEAHRERSP